MELPAEICTSEVENEASSSMEFPHVCSIVPSKKTIIYIKNEN